MKRFIAALAILLLLPTVAFALWVATDDFEAYSTGNIVAQTGGSGWSGNWTLGAGATGNFQIVSTPAVDTRAAAITAVSGFVDHGLTSTQTVGSLYFLVQRNSTSALVGARIRMPAAAGAVEYDVGMYGADIILFANTGQVSVAGGGLAANTWYEVNVEYDTTVPQLRVRYRPRLGTWSGFTAQSLPNGGSTTGAITSLGFQSLGADSTITYFDRISDTAESSGVSTNAYSLGAWWSFFQ